MSLNQRTCQVQVAVGGASTVSVSFSITRALLYTVVHGFLYPLQVTGIFEKNERHFPPPPSPRPPTLSPPNCKTFQPSAEVHYSGLVAGIIASHFSYLKCVAWQFLGDVMVKHVDRESPAMGDRVPIVQVPAVRNKSFRPARARSSGADHDNDEILAFSRKTAVSQGRLLPVNSKDCVEPTA